MCRKLTHADIFLDFLSNSNMTILSLISSFLQHRNTCNRLTAIIHIGGGRSGEKGVDNCTVEQEILSCNKFLSQNHAIKYSRCKIVTFWPTVLSVEPMLQYVVSLSVFCLSVVCNVFYCGKTVRPSQKVSEGVNWKPGSKSSFFGSPPYFYFRFRRYGYQDGRFALFLLVQPSNRYQMVEIDFLAANHVRIVGLCGQN